MPKKEKWITLLFLPPLPPHRTAWVFCSPHFAPPGQSPGDSLREEAEPRHRGRLCLGKKDIVLRTAVRSKGSGGVFGLTAFCLGKIQNVKLCQGRREIFFVVNKKVI
jgi:hypothetical protein